MSLYYITYITYITYIMSCHHVISYLIPFPTGNRGIPV